MNSIYIVITVKIVSRNQQMWAKNKKKKSKKREVKNVDAEPNVHSMVYTGFLFLFFGFGY